MFRKLLLVSAVSLGLAGGVAAAQDNSSDRFYIHLGPGGVILDSGGRLAANGSIVPGATVSINNSVTAIVEAGYYLTPNFAVSFTGGYPPTAHVYGAGSLAGVGEAATAVYGPMALTAHYHFLKLGAFQPYIGGGAVFMHIFATGDRLMTDVDVHDHFGYAGQVGADYLVTKRWGAFLDFKKAHLWTTATGEMFGESIRGSIRLDPSVVQGGLSYHF